MFSILVFAVVLATAHGQQKLPALNIQTSNVSFSAVSSGAAFAIQYHVAHSSSVMGIGIIAGPPYFCANANLEIAVSACMADPELLSVNELIAATNLFFKMGLIDNPTNLNASRVWAFSGTADTVVVQGVMDKTIQYYQHFVTNSNIAYTSNVDAEHAWLTNSYGNACSFLGSPYINNCQLDGAGQTLQQIYGPLNPATQANASALIQFDQTSYTPSGSTSTISLNPTGFAYIPSACYNGASCKLHVFVHGCEMGEGDIGNVVANNTGLNQWAEANNIVVLYPQAMRSSTIPYNPNGCWDWWGYSALTTYATQKAPQIVTIKNMIDALSGQRR